MTQEITIQPGIYQHYKGNNYQVIGLVTHSETLKKLVLYKPLYGEQALWVRPAAMFQELVEVNNESIPRFRLIKSDE